MTSDDEEKEKVKEPPIMDYLRNLRDRIDSKELKVNVDKIHDLVVKTAREGDVVEPLLSIYLFLLFYAKRVVDPASGYNMSKQNVIDIYKALHNRLIEDIQRQEQE